MKNHVSLIFLIIFCFLTISCRPFESTNLAQQSEDEVDAARIRCNSRIARITVTSDDNDIEVNQTANVTAVVRDSSGNILSGCSVTWSSNSASATVSSTGRLTGLVSGIYPGTADIIAKGNGYSGRTTITVQAVQPIPPSPVPAPAPTPVPAPAPAPSPTPPHEHPPEGSIWGTVDPVVLGTCSAEVHDRYVIDGGDGFLYRTWHPQVDPSGCRFAHEHGDNPTSIGYAEIAALPVLFGYAARRHSLPDEPHGHMEAHEGFKVFVANPGDVNDEGRVNRVYSRAVFHMGTGGPKRFANRFHGAEIKLFHPEFNLKAYTNLMMDTGGVGAVCDPRVEAPTKDVVQLNSPCMLGSFYEIWATQQTIRYQGREIYRSFATPAVFDPITVFNPANPTELVYAWDPRVDAIMLFPYNSRDNHRGCDRESYAQPGYWYNNTSTTEFYTDAMGNELPSSDPMAIKQVISRSESIGAPATNDGLAAFKMRKNYCAPGLGLKN